MNPSSPAVTGTLTPWLIGTSVLAVAAAVLLLSGHLDEVLMTYRHLPVLGRLVELLYEQELADAKRRHPSQASTPPRCPVCSTTDPHEHRARCPRAHLTAPTERTTQ